MAGGRLVGRPLPVKEEKGKGRRLVLGVELEDCVETAALLLDVVCLCGSRPRAMSTTRTIKRAYSIILCPL